MMSIISYSKKSHESALSKVLGTYVLFLPSPIDLR